MRLCLAVRRGARIVPHGGPAARGGFSETRGALRLPAWTAGSRDERQRCPRHSGTEGLLRRQASRPKICSCRRWMVCRCRWQRVRCSGSSASQDVARPRSAVPSCVWPGPKRHDHASRDRVIDARVPVFATLRLNIRMVFRIPLHRSTRGARSAIPSRRPAISMVPSPSRADRSADRRALILGRSRSLVRRPLPVRAQRRTAAASRYCASHPSRAGL